VNYFNMSNSLVAENIGEYYGGITFLATGPSLSSRSENPARITNCTIADNSYTDTNWSEGQSAGLIVERWAFVSVMNSIITSEQSPAVTVGNHSYADSPAELTIDYSMVEGGQAGITTYGTLNWGDGNIDADPLFTDAANNDYTLLAGSPAIDAGHPNAFYNDNDGTRNDMGYTGGNGIVLSATEFEFGYVGVGDSRNKTITISNLNPHDIAITGASFVGSSLFTTNQSFPVNMAYYSSADIQFTFTPNATGAQSGILQLSSNDIPPPPDTYGEFTLSGNAFDLSDGVVEVPAEVPTIQEAIDASSDGDTVQGRTMKILKSRIKRSLLLVQIVRPPLSMEVKMGLW